MNETMNYIFRKLNYLERENRRMSSSMFLTTVTAATVGAWVIYLKNHKINNLKFRVTELETKLKEAENAERE